MNKLHHIITKTQGFNSTAQEWNPVSDLYIVNENSLSDDLLIFVNYFCADSINHREVSFHFFYEKIPCICAFNPLNGETCQEELTKLIKESIVQVEEDSIQRHQRDKTIEKLILVNFHLLDSNFYNERMNQTALPGQFAPIEAHTLENLREMSQRQDIEQFPKMLERFSRQPRIICGFDHVFKTLNDCYFGKLVCFWVFGRGERAIVNGVTVGCFEDVFFESANSAGLDPQPAIKALTQKVHLDTVFSTVCWDVNFRCMARMTFPLSMYMYVMEWIRSKVSSQDADSITQEEFLRLGRARVYASQIIRAQKTARMLRECVEDQLPAAHKKEVLGEFIL